MFAYSLSFVKVYMGKGLTKAHLKW